MRKFPLNFEDLAVETFLTGVDLSAVYTTYAIAERGVSGNGCTVDTTCAPTCDATGNTGAV